ncbi:hypothetical protein OC846_001289 [Tilletia horrida]|uniref:Uncharacterized protein n=1 Tax=Tilletia horrida TaxID=155126 RepID=A0AAN6JTM1_9BASI|nr:hypothetical protein OC845_001256 [Tilletia horrida]KAK0556195.1 hypothetical protein OC846_001289 [Tilletia horrida]KAK0569142.1 hypothetical protein OC861_001282 [Tilletia horrida]
MSGTNTARPDNGLDHLVLPFDAASFPSNLTPPPLKPRFLFRLQARLEGRPPVIGLGGAGVRLIVPVLGGQLVSHPEKSYAADVQLQGSKAFDGGRVIKGGADYLRRTEDGIFWPTAHYAIVLTSGHYMYVNSEGTRVISPDAVDPKNPQPHEMMFRLRMKLESDDPDADVQKACKGIVVTSAVRGPDGIAFDAYLME